MGELTDLVYTLLLVLLGLLSDRTRGGTAEHVRHAHLCISHAVARGMTQFLR